VNCPWHLPDPFWSVVPDAVQPPCQREMPGFIGLSGCLACDAEKLAGPHGPRPAI
jgi:hypothetical protein